jgi:exopolyphosphatase/guanosine-5'-triphosphate,3'-diphosphate pyrophosphatase
MSATRVAVVDLGSNSTRLLIADVAQDGTIAEIDRRSTVTQLGQGVDRTGVLSDEAILRVFAALEEYRKAIDDHGADVTIGVLTSAVRDAANGQEFTAAVREHFGIAARTIPGEEEAQLTYLGATSEAHAEGGSGASDDPVAVIDIGGGSTEIVVGAGRDLRFHVSTQVGVVRHGERHLHTDPPTAAELAALRADAARTFAEHVRDDLHPAAGIAVAGTATQTAAILDSTHISRDDAERLLARLAALPLAERRQTPGLDPARAPTIVAGIAILLEAMDALGLPAVEASDHDILRGAALQHTTFQKSPPHFSG